MKNIIGLTEVTKDDLPFLLKLWNDPRVMKYAGYPEGMGLSEADIKRLWDKYRIEHAKYGLDDTQFVIKDGGGTRLGETRPAFIPEGLIIGDWRKPEDTKCFMTDIKLAPRYWRQGIGTDGMRLVMEYTFDETDCELLVVPPHRDNPAALRLYEKMGFCHTGISAWPGHIIMELTKRAFNRLD
jgi:aminoglycoside 2''-phosphotransferase